MSETKSDSGKSTLRERIRNGGEGPLSIPPEPRGLKTSIAATGNGYIMSIPEPGGFQNSVAYIIYSIVFGLAVGWYFVWPILSVPSPDPMRLVIGGFFTLAALGPLLGALKRFLLRKMRVTIVTVSPAFFRVEGRNGFKSTVQEIPSGEIRDLILPADADSPAAGKRRLFSMVAPSPGITAVSGKANVTFGRGLPRRELVYIRSLISKTIATQD